jgi:hypothetical protein
MNILAHFMAWCNPVAKPPKYWVKLARGTIKAHEERPFPEQPKNFSLVTDAPEMRYHDGVTPGGIVIPLDEETWKKIMADYGYDLK